MRRACDYDAAVIGAGPAGSAAAAALARAGARVLLCESERFPRFHIGESLLPASNAAFRELGIADQVRAAGFVAKRGATFTNADGSHRVRIDFSCARDVPDPQTWQVPRDELDRLLCDHATECGATLAMPAEVRGVRFEAEAAVLDVAERGSERIVRAACVLDASGRRGVLARALGVRVPEPTLRKIALFAHYEADGGAGTGDDPGDIRVVTCGADQWFWVIPLPGGRCSVGVVFDRRQNLRRPGESPAETLDRCVATTPAVLECVPGLQRVGEARGEADFSYATRAYAGDRWLLVGDAGSFLDPVFSSGVHLALRSGLDAARAVASALKRGAALNAREFRSFDREQRRRYRFFRRFVVGFYRPAFRDLLFNPEPAPAAVSALVSALSGNDSPSLVVGWRQLWFFALVALQARFQFVPPVATDAASTLNTAPEL